MGWWGCSISDLLSGVGYIVYYFIYSINYKNKLVAVYYFIFIYIFRSIFAVLHLAGLHLLFCGLVVARPA
jgi:hypothetical protein